jgi:hypothetical protein
MSFRWHLVERLPAASCILLLSETMLGTIKLLPPPHEKYLNANDHCVKRQGWNPFAKHTVIFALSQGVRTEKIAIVARWPVNWAGADSTPLRPHGCIGQGAVLRR